MDCDGSNVLKNWSILLLSDSVEHYLWRHKVKNRSLNFKVRLLGNMTAGKFDWYSYHFAFSLKFSIFRSKISALEWGMKAQMSSGCKKTVDNLSAEGWLFHKRHNKNIEFWKNCSKAQTKNNLFMPVLKEVIET